jgi:arginyl-tRNA synthetase
MEMPMRKPTDHAEYRVAKLVVEALRECFGIETTASEVRANLRSPPDPKMGDYSFAPFKYAKAAKTSPPEIAKAVVEHAKAAATDEGIEVSPAGPYANFTLSSALLARTVLEGISRTVTTEGGRYADSGEGAGKTIVVEYSSPNIAKPFGIGHLRSTVIGKSLIRLNESAGYRVVKLNYPGDWGTQFGLMLTAWRKWGDDAKLESDGVEYLVSLYTRANAEAKEDKQFHTEAREAFKRLEDGDEDSLALWRRFREASLKEFERVYDLLGVEFDSLDGEAATRPLIDGAIAELEKRGLLVKSEGAMVVELGLGDNVPPGMIRKSDGATTYLARDLAAVLERKRVHDFGRCVYVVGRDQELHFRQLFRILELMKLDWAEECVHIPFGMIRFGGEKMRTRAGTTVGLGDVLDRAFEEVGKVVASREKGAELEAGVQERASRSVAIGAVIYADLSRKRIKDYDFDWTRAFSLDGDSGPYLQYAHARACGILRKAGREVTTDVDFALLSSEPERALLKTLGHYPDMVALARRDDEPSVLATYIVELGSALNFFYNNCRVLGEDDRALEDARLLLVRATRDILAEALWMLGIEAPASM